MTSFYAIILLVVSFIAIMTIASISTPKKEKLPDNLSDELIAKIALEGKREQATKYYQALHHVRPREAREAIEKILEEKI